MSGSGVDAAIEALLRALRAEGVSPIEDGGAGITITGLTADQRLLLAALDRTARPAPEPGSEASAEPCPPVPVAPLELPDVWAAPVPQTPTDPVVVSGEPAPTAPFGTVEPIRSESSPAAPVVGPEEGLCADLQAAEAVAPADASVPVGVGAAAGLDEATGALETGEDAPLPNSTDPEPMVETQHPLDPVVVENLVEVPQPGGVPTIPARATAQGDAVVTPLEIVKKTVFLKNARMNEPYVGLIDVPGLRGLRLMDDGGTGLRLDEAACTLSGQPGTSGDFVVRVQGLLAGRRCDVLANLAVIPDPRSLWISKPSDPTAPFAKDDEDSDISRGDLLCVAASKRGRSHAREGLFRDDDFALWTGGADGWNIAVVADGAGSAKYSRRGSQIAVKTVVRDLPQLLDEHLTGQIDGLVTEHLNGLEGADERIRAQLYRSLATAAFNAAKAISDEAVRVEEQGAAAFSTTLVLSVARKGLHGWFIGGFSIGDGGAAIFDLPSRKVFPLTLADSGEFAGQTRFLQKSEFAAGYEEVAKRLFFNVRDSFTAVLAMTDGITDPKFPTDAAFANSDVWCNFWETDLSQSVLLSRGNPALERELLAWLDFWSPGNHDDRTIAIMLP
jgi:serine/threonine protein phosphatase PrpC